MWRGQQLTSRPEMNTVRALSRQQTLSVLLSGLPSRQFSSGKSKGYSILESRKAIQFYKSKAVGTAANAP